jgi:hypothetical protein
MELIADDTARTNPVYPQGSIQQNTRVVFVEWGLGHYRLDPLFAHLHHQHHACPKKLHSIIE